ncbi:hypothetical protein BUALT_Bualt14G0030900 [Buddleja alternifolia]|uniref:Uncharacterized protein n=1 Tax=Buddleja alternifolia TaxID=168488 RepID=A0AAV6WP14_9LAMI|nr:hypothetical protein BUALT_Bualt14G0030900 [Buddleja alternifolia]
MHAITGIHDFKTMRVTGVTKGKPIHILIDIGSTHNFMDLDVAKNLGCKLEPITPFAVPVADGNKIHNSYICKGFSSKMKGVKFTTDLITIPLGGCDMVLGVQWLVTLVMLISHGFLVLESETVLDKRDKDSLEEKVVDKCQKEEKA